MRHYNKMILLFLCIGLMISLCSCSLGEGNIEKVRDLDFTVVTEKEIPEKLMTIINEKKETPFKLTYTTEKKDYLYIAVGYGTQNTGGYSIAVEELFLADNAIYFDTELIGPNPNEAVTSALSYPYIVVKTEYSDMPVVFE